MIALRYNLLGGNFNPGAVLWFYQTRSRIVHGDRLGLAGSLDTWHVRLLCFEVLDLLVRQAQRMPGVTTLEDVVSAAITAEKLAEIVGRFEMGIYEGQGNKKILGFAKGELKKLAV